MTAPRVEVETRKVYGKRLPPGHPSREPREVLGVRYQVVVMLCEGMVSDGGWVRLSHSALFADYGAARALAAKVRAALHKPAPGTWGGLNLSHWIWSPGLTNAFHHLQAAPTAREYNVG